MVRIGSQVTTLWEHLFRPLIFGKAGYPWCLPVTGERLWKRNISRNSHCSLLSKHEWTTWAASGQLFEVIEKIKEGKRGNIEDSEELNTGGQPDLKEDL